MTLINHADVLDLRDLATLAKECAEAVSPDPDLRITWHDSEDARETLNALDLFLRDLGYYGISDEAMAEVLENYADNTDPTLIAADYFETYARELADDLGMVDKDAAWPLRHIDWQAAADELATDYNEVALDGHDYLIRA